MSKGYIHTDKHLRNSNLSPQHTNIMSNLRNIQIADNLLLNITSEIREELYSQIYDDEKILCIDCVHPESPETTYCWYIPVMSIAKYENVVEGNVLSVAHVDTEANSLVRATSKPYYKTKEQHIEDIHPYCPVVDIIADKFIERQYTDIDGDIYDVYIPSTILEEVDETISKNIYREGDEGSPETIPSDIFGDLAVIVSFNYNF